MKLHAQTLIMVLLLFPCIKSRAAAPDSLITSDSTAVTNAFELHMELVSQYVWRGLLLDRNPQLQPVLEFSAGPLLFGACASHSLGSSFSEIDLYAAFSTKMLTIAVYDYYYMDLDHLDESPFFRYRNTDSLASPHTLDANVILNDVFIPNLSLTASVFLPVMTITSCINVNTATTWFSIMRHLQEQWNSYSVLAARFLPVSMHRSQPSRSFQ